MSITDFLPTLSFALDLPQKQFTPTSKFEIDTILIFFGLRG